MRLLAVFALVAMLSAVPCRGQAAQPQTPTEPQADRQTLQQILTELRGIHNDVRLGQTSQILLTEMQMQHDVVSRARQKRDDLSNGLTQMQVQQKNFAVQLAQIDDAVTAELDPARKKQLTDQENQFKAMIASMKTQEDKNADELHDAEAQLSKEQDTLDNIQAQLDAVVKLLQPAGKP
jgi:hypothetical protein